VAPRRRARGSLGVHADGSWKPLRVVATFYVEFFRNVPLLVWMFFW